MSQPIKPIELTPDGNAISIRNALTGETVLRLAIVTAHDTPSGYGVLVDMCSDTTGYDWSYSAAQKITAIVRKGGAA